MQPKVLIIANSLGFVHYNDNWYIYDSGWIYETKNHKGVISSNMGDSPPPNICKAVGDQWKQSWQEWLASV